MTTLFRICVTIIVYGSAFSLIFLGILICVLGILGWIGPEILNWSFQYYFLGIVLVLMGFLLPHSLHLFIERLSL